MLFLAGIDGAILGIVLAWHGVIETNFMLLVFGFAIVFVSDWLLHLERKRRDKQK